MMHGLFGRIALQFGNGDWRFFHEIIHAGSFAEFFNRANFAATSTHDIGHKNGMRTALDIIRCDLPDKFWHINTRWTTFHTGCIITK